MVVVPKAHEVILAEVLEEIVRGEHPEGAKLPKEKALAERFGLSRYVARQAIQALRDRGLVTVTHGVGAFVAPRHRWNLFDPVLLEAMFSGPEAKAARAEAAECSASVWPHVAALAAKRRKAADLKRLDAADDAQELRNALVAAARNRFLGQVVSTLDASVPGDAGAYADVVDAVRGGDEAAARAAMGGIAGR
jgi:GntR family transcriptional repressor for pyruvate dehydrogenase complex